MRPFIYVAGPISKGPMHHNIRQAIEVKYKLWDLGWCPFIPQTSFFEHMIFPRDDGEGHVRKDGALHFWMAYDLEIIKRCQALYRLPGESVGADMEVKWAGELGLPVYYSLNEVPSY